MPFALALLHADMVSARLSGPTPNAAGDAQAGVAAVHRRPLRKVEYGYISY
jgi:hypothetical protein